MTENEIIKALNACFTTPCTECPLHECETDFIPSFVIDLINRLQAENSNLTSDLTSLKKDLTSAQAKIESLQVSLESMRSVAKGFQSAHAREKGARNTAIQDFAERLKATFPAREDTRCTLDDCYTLDIIDNLVKEMAGGNDV